jgi:uncharacterized protein (UPF0261 family)
MVTVAVLGTCDTKLDELVFIRDRMRDEKVDAILIDVGLKDVSSDAITISRAELVKKHGNSKDTSELSRGESIKFMAGCATHLVRDLYNEGVIHGIISAGGSGGTSLASRVMQDALPIGFPKLIVSTVASGDTGPIVGETDISLMYSVVDIAGVNQILKDILCNASAAIAASASSYARRVQDKSQVSESKKKRVGVTMFGVTTPGADAIRKHLEANYPIETYIFHATGHGGKAMERLVAEGRLDAVLDLTTTEVCDHITGGVMSAGGSRLDAAVKAGIPNIISLGATDMTNFGAKDTVPEKYRDRKLYEHNAMVTLMRTSPEEAREVGKFISEKLQKAEKPELIQVWIPKGGISMIAVPGGPFADEEADACMFDEVRTRLKGSGIQVVEDDRHVNDEGFARDIAKALAGLL